MAYINGRLYICERCDILTFCKCTGEGEADGGWTRWNNFEPLPDGWDSHHDTGLLCPKCNSVYEDLIKKFKEVVGEENA